MKYVNKVITTLVLTGVLGASVGFWSVAIAAISDSSPAGAVVLAVILAASAAIVFSSLKEVADTAEKDDKK